MPANWSLNEKLRLRTQYSTSGFFAFSVGQDDKNATRNLMSLDQGGIGLPSRDYYLNRTVQNDTVLSAYAEFLFHIAEKIGDAELEHVQNVVIFEQEMAKILSSSAERRQWDKMYSLMNVSQLQEICPSISWQWFFDQVTNWAGSDGLPTDEIIVYGQTFFNRLNTLLEKTLANEEGQKVLHNYIVFRTILKFVPQLGSDFRELYDTFQNKVTGKKGSSEQWETCVMDTSDMLGFALGSVYISEHFPEVAREKSEEMIAEIRATFKQRIMQLGWMDDTTKEKALEKADSMRYNIGYPEWCANETALNEYYENFTVTDDNLLNHVNYFRYALGKMMKRLREKPDPDRWSMVPMQVNAYYTASQNKIVFPAGILQPPFFSDEVPSALNFGGIGMVIGHEIVHAFDDTGRLFFKNGELFTWWDETTDSQFRSRTRCIANQYSQYKSGDLNIRGNQTVGENIADNGGIKVAYQAYKTLQAKKGKLTKEIRLPGINLNEDQMFFVNFAQVCWKNYNPFTIVYFSYYFHAIDLVCILYPRSFEASNS